MLALRRWCQLLETHSGRDKVIRAAGYVCTILSELPVRFVFGNDIVPIFFQVFLFQAIRSSSYAAKIKIVGRQLSACRIIQRLFDDLPQLSRTLNYGLGSGEKDLIIRCSMLLSNFVSTVYYPIEHIAWAGDQTIMPVDSKPFWRGVSYCWVSTMYLAIIR